MLQTPVSPCSNPGSVYEVTFRPSTTQAISSAQQLVSVHHPEGTNQRVGQTPPVDFTKIITRHHVPGSLELYLPSRLRLKDFPSNLRWLRVTSTCPCPSHPVLPGSREVTGASLKEILFHFFMETGTFLPGMLGKALLLHAQRGVLALDAPGGEHNSGLMVSWPDCRGRK